MLHRAPTRRWRYMSATARAALPGRGPCVARWRDPRGCEGGLASSSVASLGRPASSSRTARGPSSRRTPRPSCSWGCAGTRWRASARWIRGGRRSTEDGVCRCPVSGTRPSSCSRPGARSTAQPDGVLGPSARERPVWLEVDSGAVEPSATGGRGRGHRATSSDVSHTSPGGAGLPAPWSAAYRLLAQNSSDIVFRADLAGRCLWISPSVEAGHRLAADRAGRPDRRPSWAHPDDRAAVVAEAPRRPWSPAANDRSATWCRLRRARTGPTAGYTAVVAART